jgi:hypothetical protein
VCGGFRKDDCQIKEARGDDDSTNLTRFGEAGIALRLSAL